MAIKAMGKSTRLRSSLKTLRTYGIKNSGGTFDRFLGRSSAMVMSSERNRSSSASRSRRSRLLAFGWRACRAGLVQSGAREETLIA